MIQIELVKSEGITQASNYCSGLSSELTFLYSHQTTCRQFVKVPAMILPYNRARKNKALVFETFDILFPKKTLKMFNKGKYFTLFIRCIIYLLTLTRSFKYGTKSLSQHCGKARYGSAFWTTRIIMDLIRGGYRNV